ncbi:MAG: hypothetical protein H7098_03700 [Oligoflexus sp.]|nr:hypothetical protein [Pseudopedobacter sp.]
MKHKNLIPLKALFLLFVFCMSTVVSFACALGVEMGYNQNHHQEVSLKVLSAQKHEHTNSTKHEHADNSKHQHPKTDASHSKSKPADDCCKKEAKKFGQFDKIVAKISLDINQPVIFISFIQSFYSFDLIESAQLVSFRSNLYQSDHPPISDKRIAIQSFLI